MTKAQRHKITTWLLGGGIVSVLTMGGWLYDRIGESYEWHRRADTAYARSDRHEKYLEREGWRVRRDSVRFKVIYDKLHLKTIP